jgi:hypothetical protein
MAPGVAQRFAVVGALVAAVLGGVVGWVAAFIGLSGWGLVIGLAATLIVISILASQANGHRQLSVMAAFAFAFVLLTWPLLFLLVGYIRYAITGEPLGS